MVSESTSTPETGTAPPRIPRLGAAASGLVSLLLVGAIFAVPLLGLLIAPLALLPVAHFQAGGGIGARAWGPVAGLLVVASVAGMGAIALPLLAAFLLIVVLPAASIEAWARWNWSEGRWAGVAALSAAVVVLAVIGGIAAPLTPMVAVSGWLREAAAGAAELYAAWGLAEGEVELALDAAERMASWILPSLPVAYLVMELFWVRPRLALLGYPMAAGVFEDYRNDDWLAAVFAVAGIGTLALQGTARWVAVNLLLVVLILYFVQGLAIIRAHLARWIGRGWLVRWGVVLLSLQVPMPLLVAALGVADSFHPLRPRVDEDGGTE